MMDKRESGMAYDEAARTLEYINNMAIERGFIFSERYALKTAIQALKDIDRLQSELSRQTERAERAEKRAEAAIRDLRTIFTRYAKSSGDIGICDLCGRYKDDEKLCDLQPNGDCAAKWRGKQAEAALKKEEKK